MKTLNTISMRPESLTGNYLNIKIRINEMIARGKNLELYAQKIVNGKQ